MAEEALKGAPWAIQMIADRLDGRPLQQSETKVEMDGSQLFLEILREMQKERIAPPPQAQTTSSRLVDAVPLIEHTPKIEPPAKPARNGGPDHSAADAAVAAARTPAPRSDGWAIEYEAEEQQAVGLNRPPLLD